MGKKDLNKLNFGELEKEVSRLKIMKESVSVKKVGVWNVGKNYVLRTVTMINVGKIIAVTDQEIVLEDAAWIADTGRWSDFVSKGNLSSSSEVEPWPDGQVIVGRQSIIDACEWKHDLLREQK